MNFFRSDNSIPLQKDLVISVSYKPITSFAWSDCGNRFAVGCVDSTIHFYDFQSIAFTNKPTSQHHIQDGSVPRRIECNRYALSVCVLLSNGNMCMFESTNYRKYAITNYMLNNNGKLNGVGLIRSYPISAGRCLTVFSDEDGDSMTTSVIHGIKENEFRIIRILPRNVFDLRCSISSACYDMTGHLIILGCEDGSLHVFNTAYNISCIAVNNCAHKKSIIDIQCHPNGKIICTRSCDNTIKLWDLNNLSSPQITYNNIQTPSSNYNISFSPNGDFIVLAVPSKDNSSSELYFYHTRIDEYHGDYPLCCLKFGRGEITKYVIWHSRLNQIMVGMENGTVHILYDNNKSDFGGLVVEKYYKILNELGIDCHDGIEFKTINSSMITYFISINETEQSFISTSTDDSRTCLCNTLSWNRVQVSNQSPVSWNDDNNPLEKETQSLNQLHCDVQEYNDSNLRQRNGKRQKCELRSNNSFINGMEFTTYSDDMSDNSDNNTFIYHSKRRKLSELFQCDYE